MLKVPFSGQGVLPYMGHEHLMDCTPASTGPHGEDSAPLIRPICGKVSPHLVDFRVEYSLQYVPEGMYEPGAGVSNKHNQYISQVSGQRHWYQSMGEKNYKPTLEPHPQGSKKVLHQKSPWQVS